MTEERPSGCEASGTAAAAAAGNGAMAAAAATAAANNAVVAADAAAAPSTSATRTTPAPRLAAALACNFCARVLLDAVVAPNCMHAFCAPCIDAWVEARAAACPCCVAAGARQPTPLGDGAYAAGRLQPDLTLRSIVGKVLPFERWETGSKSDTIEEEWNARFAQALESARRGAVAARGFLAEGAPCVGGVSAAGAAATATAAAAAAAAAMEANTPANAAGTATATGAPRFNRAAPPPRGSAVLLLLTPDPTAPRRRSPGYLQRPYVRAPGSLTLGLLGRYLSDRMRVTASSIKWRFEARGIRAGGGGGRGGGGGGGENENGGGGETFSPSPTHDGTEAVAAAIAARGAAITMTELASAAWGGSEAEEEFERLDRQLVAFYRT